MKISHDINDAFVPSITAARLAYNAALPQTVTVDENGVPLPPGQTLPNPALAADDEEFLIMGLDALVKEHVRKFVVLPKPPAPPAVPQEVSAAQGMAALIVTNRAHLVQPLIDAMPEDTDEQRIQKALTQNAWSKSSIWKRHDPFLLSLAAGLELTDQDLDDLFVLADTL